MANGDDQTRPPDDDDLPTQAWRADEGPPSGPQDPARPTPSTWDDVTEVWQSGAPAPEPRTVVIGREDAPSRGPEFRGISRYSSGPPPPRHERAASVGRAIGFVVAATALIGAPWWFLTRGPSEDFLNPTKPPPGAVRPMPTAKGTPTVAAEAGRYLVSSKGACVRIRQHPTLDGEILDCLQSGIEVTSDGQTASADGYDWIRVRDPIARVWGWTARDFLKKV